jgi:hypothetical protein
VPSFVLKRFFISSPGNRDRKEVMPRFKSNRWWTLILTLCLGIALVASVSSRATADPSIADELGGIYEGGGGSIPPPTGQGDPDTPFSKAKRSQRLTNQPAAEISTGRAAGDGMPVDSDWMWRIRVALYSLRYWSFVRL